MINSVNKNTASCIMRRHDLVWSVRNSAVRNDIWTETERGIENNRAVDSFVNAGTGHTTSPASKARGRHELLAEE